MSNDLISRESLIENLRKFAPEHYNALINDLIMKEPVAFDKGKIIEELQRHSHNYYPSIDHYCISEKAVKLRKAIEIVEEGNVDSGTIPTDVITISLKELISEYGDNGTFFVKGKEIPAKDLIKELEDNTETGNEFRKDVTKTIISYFMKFGGSK